MTAAGIDMNLEPYNLFSDAIPSTAFAGEAYANRKLQGLVPDAWANMPPSPKLIELKGMGLGISTYFSSASNEPGHAIESRAQSIPGDYIIKAKNFDVKYNATPPGTIGPLEKKLRSFCDTDGPCCIGIAFGHFGEINDDFETLIGTIADIGTQRMSANMAYDSHATARAVTKHTIRLKVAFAVQMANISFLRQRLSAATSGFGAASQRRARADRRFWGRGGSSAAHAGYQSTFRGGYGGGSRGW